MQLKGKKLLKIILREDANLLDEVVVVGYGTQKKINVTGAIAQVDNKELKMAPSGSLSGMLAGPFARFDFQTEQWTARCRWC